MAQTATGHGDAEDSWEAAFEDGLATVAGGPAGHGGAWHRGWLAGDLLRVNMGWLGTRDGFLVLQWDQC